MNWKKSSYSAAGNCVELAEDGDHVLMRDSKHPNGPVLTFTRPELDAFIRGAQAGEFDECR